MYATITGKVTSVKPNYVVLENNKIGYLIISPRPFSYKLGEESKVYIHHYVRDDINNLYGFESEEQKDLFISLISVSGIGPKTALSILASGAVNDVINAIETSDVKYLTKFPGIGKKSAAQIILDLKGKLVEDVEELLPVDSDAELALLSLGYNKREVKKALGKVDPDLPVEEQIKKAFTLLLK